MARKPLFCLVAWLLGAITWTPQAGATAYYLWDGWGGACRDANKTIANTDDDDMCWAAAAANVLDWGGWDAVGLNTADLIWENAQYHWKDVGGQAFDLWQWWFNGSAYAGSIDVPGGGNHFPNENLNNYYRFQAHGETMATIYTDLHDGYGVALDLSKAPSGGHAVTVWGIEYHEINNGGTTTRVYDGLYLTESDDDQGSPFVHLFYVPVTWNSQNQHYWLGGSLDGWRLTGVFALRYAPTTHWVYDFQCTYANGDYYQGVVYAAARYGYGDDQTMENRDKGNNLVSTFTLSNGRLAANPNLDGMVYVTFYHDQESGKNYQGGGSMPYLGIGFDYLGTESGYIIQSNVPDFAFSPWNEADLIGVYHFTHYYNNGQGDRYQGRFYASQQDGWQMGVVPALNHQDDNQQPGYYEITGISYFENTSRNGEVYVDKYYDAEIGVNFIPLRVGTAVGHSSLGSEWDYVIQDSVTAYFFGSNGLDGLIYEADGFYTFYFSYTLAAGQTFSGQANIGADFSIYLAQNSSQQNFIGAAAVIARDPNSETYVLYYQCPNDIYWGVGINNYADHTGFSVAWRVSAPQAYLYTWYDAATATYTFVNYDSSSGEIYAGLGYGGLPSGAFVGAPFTNLGYFSTGAYYIPGGSSSTYSYEVFYRRNYWPLVHALCFLDQEY